LKFGVSRQEILWYGFASIGRALKVERYYMIVGKIDQLYKEGLVGGGGGSKKKK